MATENDPATLLLACFQKALGHELPNLLVTAQGIARTLAADEADPEQKELLGELAGAVHQADALVRRLAKLGRTLREPPRREPVPLGELFAELDAELRLTRDLPAGSLDLAPDLPTLTTDGDRLRAALLPLLRNAYQAARGELPLVVRVEWKVEQCVLRLTDNGRGLPSRPVESLYEPFHPGTPGQGLGLFTARVLLASLGATLSLADTGAGTAVEICLPASEGISR